jgi:hypothetical protein
LSFTGTSPWGNALVSSKAPNNSEEDCGDMSTSKEPLSARKRAELEENLDGFMKYAEVNKTAKRRLKQSD